jgi:hypothetical protein
LKKLVRERSTTTEVARRTGGWCDTTLANGELNVQLHVGQIEHALQSRVVIEQAKGIIAEQEHISIDDAFDRLRSHARRHERPLDDVALAVTNGELTAVDLME